MSFTEKYLSNKHRFGMALSDPKKTNTHTKIMNQNGQVLNLKTSQLLNLHQHKATHLYTSSTNLSNAMNGGITTILIQPDSFNSYMEQLYLTIVVNNDSGGAVDLMPMPFWFRRIEYRIGNDLLQEEYSEQLHNDIANYPANVWKNKGYLWNYDEEGRYLPSRQPIPNGDTRRYYMRIGKFFTQSNFYLPAISGELRIRIFWRTFADYVLDGTQPSLDEVGIEIQSAEQLNASRELTLREHRRMPFHYRYGHYVRDIIPKTISASGELPVELNSFSGSFTELSVYVRPQGATGLQLIDFESFAIDRIQLENSDGERILGSTPVHYEENIMYFNDVGYDNSFVKESSHYRLNFNKNAPIDNEIGAVTGFFPLDTRSRLRLFFGPLARAKTITLTGGGPSIAGEFRLSYEGEKYGTYKTIWLAFNATTAAIEAALDDLLIATKTNTTFTLDQQFSAGDPVVITFSTNGMNLGRLDPQGTIYMEGDLDQTISYNSVITQQFREGINNTAVDIVIIGKQIALMELSPEGLVTKRTT